MTVYNSIQLDLCKKNSYKAIPTKQLDTNSRFLRVELLNNGNSYDFSDDVTVILASTRNGEAKAYKCTVEDGCVVAPLTSWMLAEEGYVDCEIVLIDTASNSKLSSFAFSICVDESIYNDETISQDENYNVLLQLITDVDTAVKSCNTATEKATEIYNTVETKLNNGELKGEKGDKGDKGDTYELTAQDKRDIVNQIPNASPSERGIMSVPNGCGIIVDSNGSARVVYPVTDITSTTDDIIVVKHTGGSTDGQFDLTFNAKKFAQTSELPTKTSELENDSNFVSDENYIHTDNNFTNEEKTKLENDVATKDYVEQEIATFDFIKIVEALPEQGLPNRTYFVPKTDQQTNDLYDEYMWVNNKWEFVGTRQIEVDLTNYVKNTDYATTSKGGIVQISIGGGLVVDNNKLRLDPATTVACKLGIYSFVPIAPAHQHEATFYGLAKASGDTTQSKSSNAVGKYTDEAKTKIQNMLGVQPKFELGNGLQLVDGVLSLDIPVASASTTYGGGDAQ